MNDLTTYSNDIAKWHQQAQQHAESAIECALKAGQLLVEAKTNAQHGEWLPFLESTGVNARTAQRYMRLASHADQLKYDSVSHLSVTQALEYLSEPKPVPDDEFKPPASGEYLEFSCGRYTETVWRYNDDSYHYVYWYPYLNNEGREMGYPMIHTTLKPVSWGDICSRVNNIEKMERSTKRTMLSALWRDNCWLGSGMNADDFTPNTADDTQRHKRFSCSVNGIDKLEWSGAEHWEARQDPGFKVVGLIFPEMKKDPSLDDFAFRINAGEINLKNALAREKENQREMIGLLKEAKKEMKLDDKAFDDWCKKNDVTNLLKHPQEVEW